MKILYAIQGTGNGHVSRARDIIPVLKNFGEVDILISGTQTDVQLPYKMKYILKGLCFVFGKKGGIDYFETFRKNNVKNLFKEINTLPVQDYDMVISDFEPVSAWACVIRNKPCVGLSHQFGVCSKHAPRPEKKDIIGSAILKFYAPATYNYGFHFLPYDKNIFTPVIRKEVRSLAVPKEEHYTVYLPAYSDKLIVKMLSRFPDIQWQVFSKHTEKEFQTAHISIKPVNNEAFVQSMASATGVLCGAGFETPAEVIYLQKKLMVIPMKGQYEQQCNAAALKLLGVPVIRNLKSKQFKKLQQWIDSNKVITVDFPDDTEYIIDTVINEYLKKAKVPEIKKKAIDSPAKFRELLMKKIFNHAATK